MAKLSNAQLRAEIKRLRSDIRRIQSEERLGAEFRKVSHRRARVRFAQLTGKYRRAGHNFVAAVRLAQKEYRRFQKRR